MCLWVYSLKSERQCFPSNINTTSPQAPTLSQEGTTTFPPTLQCCLTLNLILLLSLANHPGEVITQDKSQVRRNRLSRDVIRQYTLPPSSTSLTQLTCTSGAIPFIRERFATNRRTMATAWSLLSKKITTDISNWLKDKDKQPLPSPSAHSVL